MSWLDKMTEKMLKRLPKRRFSPTLTFGFDDINSVIAIVERVVADFSKETLAYHQEEARKAALDPHHSLIERPVFAPMAAALWSADMTFPLILRRSLFIAICSHVEHVLRQWCGWLHDEWKLGESLKSLKKIHSGDGGKESDLHRCVRYLRDGAGLGAIGSFETWPEWVKIDACRVARNCLTHNGGIVDALTERKTIETLPHVTVDDSGFLHEEPVVNLRPGACEDAASNAKSFFARLTTIAEADPRSVKP